MPREELVDAYLNGSIDRRTMVRRMVVAGASAAAATTLVAGLDALPAQAGGHDDHHGHDDNHYDRVPNPNVSGPIRATARPGDPSHNYPFFASQFDLKRKGYVEEEFFFSGKARRYKHRLRSADHSVHLGQWQRVQDAHGRAAAGRPTEVQRQALQAIHGPKWCNPLGKLKVRRIIADGESQSASRLSQYYNAVQPTVGLADAFILNGAPGANARVRTDLKTPAFRLLTETDVAGLSGALYRQADTKYCAAGRWPAHRTRTST